MPSSEGAQKRRAGCPGPAASSRPTAVLADDALGTIEAATARRRNGVYCRPPATTHLRARRGERQLFRPLPRVVTLERRPGRNRTAERPNIACVERPAAACKKALATQMG